jgi:hypothetical protein
MRISCSFLPRLPAALALFCFFLSSNALANNNSSYTHIGHDITVGANEQVGDLTCIGCSIHLHGQVAGDVTAIAGSITIAQKAQVAGDVTAIGGNLRLDQAVKVAGDATVIGGNLHRDPEAAVSGDVTTLGGEGWLVPIILAPFVLLGLLAAFVVWLVQRMRRPPSVPAAAA